MLKMKELLIVFIIQLLLTPALCCKIKETPQPVEPNPTAACETRGTWMWASSIDTPEKRDHVLDLIKRANLNTVFLSIPPIEGNYGHGDGDVFKDFIKRAVQQGLGVHAWFTNARRPGGGQQADYRTPAEQKAQTDWVDAVMDKYGKYLAGAHLDYIRFTSGEDVNIDGKMDGVTATIRSIRNMLDKKYPGKYLTATCLRLAPSPEERNTGVPTWEEDVPQWFRDWYAANPGSIYHGTDFVYVPMHMKYQQNPVGWLKEGLVDAVMPMQYSILDDEWNQSVDLYKSFNTFAGNNPALIYMGLGWIPKTSPDSHKGYDAAGVARKIKYGRSIGMKGFVIFILANRDHDDTPLIEMLTENAAANQFDPPFKTLVPSCFK